MFYRRKIILALIQAFEGKIEKIALQKLLFLFTNRQLKPEYEFVPYHFGCYSFSANADLTAMVKHGFLEEGKQTFTKIDGNNYIEKLTDSDKKILITVKDNYGKLSSKSLMKFTYLNYNYYAINSKTAKDILNKQEYNKVQKSRPQGSETILFTIGYEGVSLENYLNKLLKNDVRLLIDVRNNPLSMKFGFSKNQIKGYCESLGIDYLHFPDVGIQSELRQELNSQMDYDKLFESYKKTTIKSTRTSQQKIVNLILERKRVALTCFEANICQCHRKPLSEEIISMHRHEILLKHI